MSFSTLQSNHGTLSYTVQGQGKCLLFLHGFLEDSSIWEYFIPYFSQTHQVITVDFFGHGRSSVNLDGPNPTLSDIADDLFDLLESLEINKATLIGHSMGGYLALEFAEHYPTYVQQLILINSTAIMDSEQKKQQRDRAIAIIKSNKDTFIQLAITNLFTLEAKKELKPQITHLIEQAKKIPTTAIITALEAMKLRTDKQKLIHTAAFPICFILGQKDPIMDYNLTKQQLEGTNCQLISLPQGHMLHLEARQEIEQIISSLL
ncbi:alpha/beta fold hydrolase [Myroides sp. LJL116]